MPLDLKKMNAHCDLTCKIRHAKKGGTRARRLDDALDHGKARRVPIIIVIIMKGWIKFIILVVLLFMALAFLVLTFWFGPTEYINRRAYCVQGMGSLVYPGPAAPSSTYCQVLSSCHMPPRVCIS